MRQPTVREIAEACGCSRQTVSLALRGIGNISDQRRDEIIAQAKKMGWKRNPLANAYMSQLRQQHRARYTGNIAMITFNEDQAKFHPSQSHMLSIIKSARERAEELGYTMELIWAHEPGMNAKTLDRILYQRNILGVLVSSEIKQASWISEMTWDRYSVGGVGLHHSPLKIDIIDHDRARSMDMAFSRIVDYGYRKIGHACNELNLKLSGGKSMMNYEWLGRMKYPDCIAEPFIFSEVNEQTVNDMQRWIVDHQLDAIIGMGLCVQLFKRLPAKLRNSIGYADLDARYQPNKRFAGVDQRHEITGKLAIEWLSKQIETNTVGIPEHPFRLLYSPGWRDGKSLPRRG